MRIRFRIQLFKWMRIRFRIQLWKMRIHAEPDSRAM
jgi:hypothetical protein